MENPQPSAVGVFQQGSGLVGAPVDSGSGESGAEALLWAAFDQLMLYAPWSLVISFGLQVWLMERWER